MKLRLISIILIVALSCTSRTKTWQVLDFGTFSLKTPTGWSIVKRQGTDSYFGGLTDGKDSLWFDYGRYDVDLIGDAGFWYRMARDTVNGFPAIFSLPDLLVHGDISMHVPKLTDGNRFTIWAAKVKDSATVLHIYKSVLFMGSDTSRNPPLALSKYFDRTNANGGTVFMSNCARCHSLFKNVEGPRLQDMMAMRSTDWLYLFFTQRKQMGKVTFHEKFKNEFNNLECPEFKNLTKEDIVALEYYVEFQQ
jgi:hypothetical protein